MDPEGKIVVVTGAAGGIGGALVRALAERGAKGVIAADIVRVTGTAEHNDEDPSGADGSNEQTSASQSQPQVQTRQLDVTDERATCALVAEVEETVGPIDVWFANAGVATGSGPEDDGDWERQWRVNVMSHVYAARALLPRWIERGEGHLVTTASMAGILSAAGDAAYSATKHAAVGLAEWLAFTYAERGVRVSCVCPGAVDTAMLRGGFGARSGVETRDSAAARGEVRAAGRDRTDTAGDGVEARDGAAARGEVRAAGRDRTDTAGDAAKASAAIGAGEVLTPEQAAERILGQLRDDRFLILTHPEMREYAIGKAQDPERWVRGMTRLWARTQSLLD